MSVRPRFAAVRVAVGLLVLLCAARARAGSISITMTATADVKDGKNLVVSLKVGNSGDEAANSVVAALHVGDQVARGERHETLDPNQSVQETLTIPLGDVTPGRWPYRLTVDYTDANQYPFQALHAASFLIGSPPPAKVAVPEIQVPAVSESSTASMTVKNLAGTARKAKVSLFVPEGLEVADPTQEIDLPAWGTTNVSTKLMNRTALAGSRYPVFVAVEYDEDGAHQTLVASSTVEVKQKTALVSRGLLWVVGGLVVVWLGYLVVRGLRA